MVGCLRDGSAYRAGELRWGGCGRWWVDQNILYIQINISIMSKGQSDAYLRYGQGILLKGFKQGAADDGLLTAKGFADTAAKYQTFKNILYFKNYRNAIFQIVPAANFEINDELRKFRQKSGSDKNDSNLKILQARAKSEKEQFQLNCESKLKQNVCFGDAVMFKHVDSDTYLSGTIRPSEKGTNGSFVVEVTKDLSQILIFKVEPFRSYEKINMPIPFDSPVKLFNTVNNGYLTYEKIGLIGTKNKTQEEMMEELERKAIPADDSYIIPVKTNSSQSEIYECVTHFDDLSKVSALDPKPMPWQFQLHMCDVENDTLIQHDIIYFQHTEKNSILSTQGKEIILKQMKKEGSEELPFYQCLWEIQEYKEASDNAYILRHLMSGMTLGIVKDSEGNPVKAELFDISEGVAEGNLGWVELKLAKKENAEIQSKSFINICIDDWCLDRENDEEIREIEEQEEKKEDGKNIFISIPKLNKLAVNELEYEVKKVKFTTEISKNCFIIKQIEDDLKKQVLFALSFHSTIIKLRQALKWGHQNSNKIEYKELMQITEKIKQIKDFLKNCSKEESELEHIRPIYKRQMICKDLGIAELLFQLLYYMFKNLEGKYNKRKDEKGEYKDTDPYIFKNPDKIQSLQKFIELYNSIYEVCYELIRDNILFKIYVSKWINFVIMDLVRQNQASHLKLLKEIFRTNQFLVKNFVDEALIESLAQKMLFQKDNFEFVEIKYLQLFRLFCVVGESINTASQIAILNKFVKQLKQHELSSLYQITLSKENEDIFAEAAIDKNKLKKRVFKDYFKICKEEYSSAWAYFVEYLHLMADMTKGRNKLVEDYMKSLFTMEIMTQLFLNEELKEAEAPITRIIHNLFIESESYYPIEKRKRISDYEKLKTEPIQVMRYPKDEDAPWKVQALVRVLNGVVGKLQKFGPIQADPTASKMLQNQNLYQLLSFIWQTLNLGFWQTKQQVKQILNNIIRILKPHEQIAADYSKASVQNRHNSLMMKCKEQCMNIIQLILDYDLDLEVRYICKYFQSFQVPVKKRQLASDQRLLENRVDNQLAIKFIEELPRKNMTLVEPTIIENMIQLSKYNNPKLTSGAISIMQRVLLKNKKAIQSFCQQIFVSSAERIALKDYIELKKDKFYIMQDQTLVKIKRLQDQVDNYVALYKEDQVDTGIMQIIYTMSEIVKNQASALDIRGIKSLEGSGMNKKLGKKKLINFTDERTSSNTMKQSVMDAENIHLKILEFILNCSEVPQQNSQSLKLLHLSYKFLVSLIWNYQNIKATLISFIPFIQHHLKKNVGCIDFLKEMYDNNKAMLFNLVNVSSLVKQICNSINNEPENSFYKSKLLDFFRFLIYCNGKTLKNNQIQILKIMQDDSFKNIILAIDKPMIEELVYRYKVDYQKYEDNNVIEALEKLEGSNYTKAIYIEPKLLYLITYFQILTSLIDDRNAVNMGKLKKRFPFDKLVDWVRAADTCWPLKRNIRAFLNRLYYFQPEIQIYMKKIIGDQLDNIIYDLNRYILIKYKNSTPEFETFFFNDPVRFSYIESYLYLNLEENLFTLYQLATDPKIQNEMKTILHPIDNKDNKGPVNFIRICERLGCIKNYFAERKNVYTNSFIKFLLSRFQSVIKEFDDDIYAPGMNLNSDEPRAPMKSEKERQRKILINKIMKGEITVFYAQANGEYDEMKPLVYRIPSKVNNPKDDKKPNQNKLLKKLREILKRQKKQFKNSDQEIDYKLNTLVTAIKLSPQADAFLTKEYNQNLKIYSQNEEILQFVTIIIDMIAKNPKALPLKEKRFFLNFITGIVEQNNRVELSEPKSIDEWETEDWIESKEHIYLVQNELKASKLGNLITELLKQNIQDDIEFADSLLLCGIAYLFGGNTNAQNNMIETIRADRENKVMKNLQNLISKLGEFIVKNIEQSSRKESNLHDAFSITTIDNWDFYDTSKKYVHRKNVFEPQTTDQQIYSKICIRAYKRAFKFLQLLCQNNNIDGKHFIRDQKNQIKNFDFIKIAAKEIRNIFIFLNTQICPVSSFLLDFILEVTQIPVKANQEDLMSLTFFEDVCALQNTFFNKPEVVSSRGFEGCQELIDQIFFKAIQIILSNFEGNDLKTFSAIDNKLQPKFLVNILTKKLAEMSLATKQDAIAYIDGLTTCEFSEDMMSVLNIIIIFIKLREKLGENCRVYSMYEKEKNKPKTNNKELFEYLQKCLIEIEIVNEGVEQTVIFPKYPVFNSLTGGLRDSVMAGVSRSSHRDKIVSLLGYTSAIKSKIESSYTLLKQQKISQNQMNEAFNVSAVMSVVLCVYMMMFYNVIINYGQADFQASRVTGLIRFGLSLVQLSMTFVYAFYWLKFKNWEHPERQARISDNAPLDQSGEQAENKVVALIKKYVILLGKKLKLDEIIFFVQYTLQGGQTTQPLYWSAQFWRVAMYVTVSFMGAFFYPPLYFIHIMDIFCYIPEIGNIFRAIGLNVTELLYVSFMGVVFTFVFCTVTFSNYQKNVYSGKQPQSELCQGMMDCILQLFVSGAISQTMDSFEIVRFVFDTIYGIFFGILFSNIISGIMLDAFTSLRDLTNQLQKDKENYCYICNIDRQTIEKRRQNFKEHINGKHFLWNYVFFIYFLDKKSPTDYSGLEYLITTQYNKSDEEMVIDWVPMAAQEAFDCKAKLEEIKAEVDDKASFLESSTSSISDDIKTFREMVG